MKMTSQPVQRRAVLIPALLLAWLVGFGGAHAQTCVTPPAGLVAWWPADGNANDIQGTNNGTLMNGATFTAGKVGQAFSFDGVDDYAVVADSEAQRPTNITIEGWFKVLQVPSAGQGFTLVSKYSGGAGWILILSPPGLFFAVHQQTNLTGIEVESSVPIPIGQWAHLACTYDGTNSKIYMNGALRGTASFPGGYTPSSIPMTIGRASHYDGGFAREEVDEFSIYNRALTETEIDSIYAAGSAGKCKLDTDDDGLSDYDESFVYGTNPLKADTDSDGIPDAWEVQHGLNPRSNDAGDDFDGDGISNLAEYNWSNSHTTQLDPRTKYSTSATASDFAVVTGTGTNQFFYDRNNRLIGAEFDRGLALAYAYDGNDNLVRQVSMKHDANTNGLPDVWEFLNGLTNNTSAFTDTDGDGWTDYQEWKAGTNPHDALNTPNLLGNPGINIASLTLPFTPSNFVVGVGQLDGVGAEEIVIGADGNPLPSVTNSIVILTQLPTGNWTTNTVPMSSVGITSIAIGQPTNCPSPAIYLGTRQTGGTGTIVQMSEVAGTWQLTNLVTSTSSVAYVIGVRSNLDVMVSIGSTNQPDQSLGSLAQQQGAWTLRALEPVMHFWQTGIEA